MHDQKNRRSIRHNVRSAPEYHATQEFLHPADRLRNRRGRPGSRLGVLRSLTTPPSLPLTRSPRPPRLPRRQSLDKTAVAGGAPALPAKAWLLMDFDSGEVLASANPDEPLPPASLTKMMTSFLVEQALRSGKLKKDDLVTVSQNAWCRGSSTESCMYLPLNSQATVIDILRGIIIQSGNDASKAIAEHMAGSEEGFAKLMNAEAKRLGMTHTNFVNATGLPDPAHKSSARDLAILARAIIRDSADYYPIYAEREFKYNGIKQGNRNALLYTDPTVDGLKTGHTEEAGYCLVTSSKRNGMRLITVILNTNSAQARADETRTLLGWGFSNFEKATPIQPTRWSRRPRSTSARSTRLPRVWDRHGR